MAERLVADMYAENETQIYILLDEFKRWVQSISVSLVVKEDFNLLPLMELTKSGELTSPRDA